MQIGVGNQSGVAWWASTWIVRVAVWVRVRASPPRYATLAWRARATGQRQVTIWWLLYIHTNNQVDQANKPVYVYYKIANVQHKQRGNEQNSVYMRETFVEIHQILEKMFCENTNSEMVGSGRRRCTSQMPHQCSYNGDYTPRTTFKITCHLVYLSLLSELDRYSFDMDGRILNEVASGPR